MLKQYANRNFFITPELFNHLEILNGITLIQARRIAHYLGMSRARLKYKGMTVDIDELCGLLGSNQCADDVQVGFRAGPCTLRNGSYTRPRITASATAWVKDLILDELCLGTSKSLISSSIVRAQVCDSFTC
jgi:hypothetical protein